MSNWTKAPPTVDGWYWVTIPNPPTICVLHMIDMDDRAARAYPGPWEEDAWFLREMIEQGCQWWTEPLLPPPMTE